MTIFSWVGIVLQFDIEMGQGKPVAGVDEAGRGPWAGPVVAAAVVFPSYENIPSGINDSKKLSAKRRALLFEQIFECAHVGIGVASVDEIDTINILAATKLAMQRAIEKLEVVPHMVLVDGNQHVAFPYPSTPVVKGDSKSVSIAAASIIAKVTRDRLMLQLAEEHPYYGWHKNAGYGTAAHQEGLASHGVTPHHRQSFAPIRKILEAA